MPGLRGAPSRHPPVRGLQPVHAPGRARRQLPALRRACAGQRPARRAGAGPVSAPAAPPVPAELEALMRRMRLPYLRTAAPEVCATARAQRWDPAEVMRVLLAEEVKGRDAATHRMRRRAAGFPSGKTLESWRPERSSIAQPTQQALMTLEWVGRAENVALCGPSGSGKSHFCEALGHAVIE